MSVELQILPSAAVSQAVAVDGREPGLAPSSDAIDIREASESDADGIHALVTAHLTEGRLLPRTLDDIRARARRFLVAVQGERVIACGELAPLSPEVGEVRSLVVSAEARSLGLGGEIVERLAQRAALAGLRKLCAFTHKPSYFVRHGFSIVPHVWLPEKIVTDCRTCAQFRRCGQYAVVRMLGPARPVLHG